MSRLLTHTLLLLPQLLAPLSTQGVPSRHSFPVATISRVPGSLLTAPTYVPGHLFPLLVPDPHVPSPLRSPPPSVPQALYVKTVPGFLPQWLMPPTTPYPGATLDSSTGQRLLQT